MWQMVWKQAMSNQKFSRANMDTGDNLIASISIIMPMYLINKNNVTISFISATSASMDLAATCSTWRSHANSATS